MIFNGVIHGVRSNISSEYFIIKIFFDPVHKFKICYFPFLINLIRLLHRNVSIDKTSKGINKMKKTTILNARLSYSIATLGHTDGLCICDAGLPIPDCVERVDLALTRGIPGFLETLYCITQEMFVERVVIAEEVKQKNPQILTALLEHFKTLEVEQGNQIQVDYVLHERFKQLTHENKTIVRTGECSPYANVILYSGVPF